VDVTRERDSRGGALIALVPLGGVFLVGAVLTLGIGLVRAVPDDAERARP